ncbi:uncharacterized protein LDX57_003619 [Aspergillus melleus]|uniref:uncharacterized protein n=1 Tax=Aspergillus melleus TaxID=138277 RepID=UPI001E8D7999|nr:uncharacterized protein LDX57_003619 [Aspergillus melleus]KAH8425881.1 hypothetical protein LDX57_003619 [Aspergillus melleus]
MSADDEDFLTPRGLLVQGSFVCDGPSFKDFSAAVDASLELPYTQDRFEGWSGLSSMGWNALISELHPILDICYTDVQSTVELGTYFREVGTVCDKILDTASTAQTDYDALFQGLNDLTNDPDNEQLRAKVKQLTADRLEGVTTLEKKTNDTFGGLKEGTDAVKDCEDQLKAIVDGFNDSQMENELREYDSEDYLEQDLAALEYIKVSAVRVVITDLTAIAESIEKLTVPANAIILGHEKAKIIRKWEDLKTEVQNFKDKYLS